MDTYRIRNEYVNIEDTEWIRRGYGMNTKRIRNGYVEDTE